MNENNGTKTVLITGASSGIGAALAVQFAKNHYDLILHGRSLERLNSISTECKKYTNHQPLVIALDLTEPNAAIKLYNELKSQNKTVYILINNAGEGLWGRFNEVDIKEVETLIKLNMTSVTELTRLCLTDMLANRSGKIVNISSVYAFTPVPYQSIYAASKAFLLSFSLALADEIKGSGVNVTVICPGTTRTRFRKKINQQESKSFFSMSANEVAKAAYNAIIKNKLVYIPGFYNWLYVKIIALMPMHFKTFLVKKLVYKLRGYKKEK